MANSYASAGSSYSSRERIVCVTLGVASTVSLSANATMANVPVPAPHTGPLPVTTNHWQPHIAPVALNANHLQSHPATHSANTLFHVNRVPQHHPLPAIQQAATDFNLASSDKSFVAGNLANFKDMTIQVGNFREIVQLDTKLTAAEVVAAEQVLTSGKQTIQISGSGAATGGTLTLNNSLLTAIDKSIGGTIGSLTISHGVQVVDALSTLSLTGNLANYGSILTASGVKGASDTISAGSILNAAGGAIGSYTGGGGLFAANPVLDASIGLTNNGNISSVGNLTINAPVVSNITASGAVSSQAPTISAGHNLNISTASLSNSGVISAAAGNINIASGAALAVNNTGGVLSASKGNINFSTQNADINLTGGNYLSKQLNLDAGSGNITLNVDDVSGVLNATGNCVHVNANSPNLILGNINASGDPLFTNSNTLTIDGSITPTNGADLTLISAQNIVSLKGNKGLDTSSKTGAGGNLTLIAGANFIIDGSGNAVLTDSANPGLGSSSGGLIDLTGKTNGSTGGVTTIKTAGAGGQNSGSVTMVAYAGTATGAGTINTGTATIDTTAKTPGKFGDVTVIAGASTVTDITIAKITGNAITVESATPTAGAGVTYSSSGSLVPGNSLEAGTATTGAISLAAKSQVTANSNVTVSSAGAVTLGIISSTGKPAVNNVSITSGGASPLTIAKTITGGTITLDAGSTSDININASIGSTTTTQLKLTGQSIFTNGAAVISGQNLVLTASKSVGSATFFFHPIIKGIATKVTDLTVNTGLDANIKQTGDVTIESSSTGAVSAFNLIGTGKVTQNGTFTGDELVINTKGAVTTNGTISALNVTTTSTVTVANTSVLTGFTNLTGSIVTNNGAIGNVAGTDSLSLVGTASGAAIINNGSINTNSADFTTTNAKGTMLTNNGSTINVGRSMSISASGLTNNGLINFGKVGGVDGLLTIGNGKGSITISGQDGGITSAPGGRLDLSGSANITVLGTDGTHNPLSGLTQLGGFGINTLKGIFTSPLSGISVSCDPNGQDGSIAIFVAAMKYNGSNPLTGAFNLIANGNTSTRSSSSQNIQMFIFASGIQVGTGVGQYNINAAGVGDGHITLSTPGVLTVNAASLVATGSTVTRPNDAAGAVILNGHQGVGIIGDLNTLNGDSKYTDISISTNTTKPFIMDGTQSAATLVNGQTSVIPGQSVTISGGTVSIINSGSLIVGQKASLDGQVAVFSTGKTLTNSGSIITPALVTGPATGSATITNNGLLDSPSTSFFVGASSGSLILTNGATGTYGSGLATFQANSDKGSVTLSGSGVVPSTASIIFTAPKGTVTLGTGTGATTVTAHKDASLNGGQISISAVGLAYSKGGLTLEAEASAGTANGGIVSVNLTGTKALPFGATGVTIDVNSTATGNGGQISVKNGGNISADSAFLKLASAGTGGDLSLQVTKGLLFVSNVQDLNAVNLNDFSLTSNSTTAFLFGNAKATGNGFGGTTPQIVGTNLSITNTGGAIDTRGAVATANDITLTSSAAKGSIIFSNTAPSTLTAIADSSGNGGTINLTAPVLTFTGGLTLNAAATAATANGGSVNVTLTATKALTIGSGGLIINVANTGTGSLGGEATVSSSGNITADAGVGGLNLGSNFASGKGASLSLSANGLLLVSNTDKIDNIGLHNVVFSSSSSTQPFALSGATSNGLIYSDLSKTFTADSITVANKGGALDTTTGILIAHGLGYTAGTVLTFGASATVQPLTDAAGNGGTITINAGTLSAPGLFTLNAAASGTGDGGNIVLNFTTSTPVSVAPSAFHLDVSNKSNQGGSVVITNNGDLSVDAGAINLGSGFGVEKGANLSLGSNNGKLLVNNVSSINNAGLHNLSFSSNSATDFTLGAAGSNGIGDVTSFTADNIAVTNKAGQIINGSSLGLSGLDTITLTSGTNAGISGVGSSIVINGTPSLVVNTGTKGNADVSITGTTSILHSNVGQMLQITATGGDLTVGGSSAANTVNAVGGITINYNNPNGDNTNSVTLGNINIFNPTGFNPSPSSPLKVNSNAQNLVVAANATIFVAPGDITLQNSNSSLTNLPSITVNAGATLHAADIPGTPKQFSAEGGNVFIAIGPTVPTSSTIVPGIIPAGNPLIIENFTIVSFGTVAFPNGSITADTTDVLTSLFRTFAFSTGSYASSQIVLAPNVTITADPPVPPSANEVLSARLLSDNMIIPASTSASTISLATAALPPATSQSPITAFANNSAVSPIFNNTISAISNLSNQEVHSGLLSSITNSITTTSNATFTAATGALSATNASVSTGTTGGGTAARSLNGSVSNTIHQTLDSGVLLLAPEQNTVVDTPYGSVAVAARSVALLVSSDKGLAIYNLHDSHKGAITINSGAQTTAITPGRSAILTNSLVRSFEEINPASFVAYRNLSSRDIGDEAKLYQAEFQIASMVRGLPAVKEMIASPVQSKRKAMTNMLKTAAILSDIMPSSEPFSYRVPPQATASAALAR